MRQTNESRPVALVADDDEVMRLMLTEMLEQGGFAVIAVADGHSALSVGRQTDFAVAMLDVEMPGQDGYGVCAALREEARRRHVPIIMITGRDDADSVNRAYNAGATDFISKPVNWPLLAHRVRYVMRNAAATQELELREAENRALIASIPDRIHLLSRDGQVRRTLGGLDTQHAPTAASSTDFATLLPSEVRQRALRDIAQTAKDGLPRSHDVEETGRGQTPRYFEMRYFRCDNGEVMAMRQDVTPRRAQEMRIRELAYFDAPTGLPNRASFLETASAAMKDLHHSRPTGAVLYVHLDGFNRIKETFGHSIGDTLVREISAQLGQRLQANRGTETQALLARIGDTEFAVFIQHENPEDMALAISADFLQRFRDPMHCNDQEFFVSPRTGVAIYPTHGRDVETLLKNAETAMRHARNASARVVYSEVMSARSLEWLALDGHLRHAIQGEQLLLHYQPKIRLQDGALTGVEALLRWHHPELGEVSPGKFIPLAEETGLILDIGAWVVRAACLQLRNWQDKGIPTSIAINISGIEFQHGSPAEIIRRETLAAGVSPTSLQIEITESILVSDSAEVQAGLRELRNLGCSIALDDFGTGYSSLAYLKRFPPDTLKIDQVFIRNVHQDRADAAIVEAILSLARRLNLTVIAEGVEQEAQLAWLKARQCDEAQGFYLHRPMSAARVEALLTRSAPADHIKRDVG
jgi:diguanylate cyclase (GGDEF)-like protein